MATKTTTMTRQTEALTLRRLTAELTELNAKIDAARAAELEQAVATCREIIDLYGLSAFDLGLIKTQQIRESKRHSKTFKPQAPRAATPPKYRDPATGKTWSGRGSMPVWMAGEDRDTFLIGEAA